MQTIQDSPHSKIPLYHRLFLILKSKIHDGEYKIGDYLPSERELSDVFKVSRITTMRALNELAVCGLVVRETGRGTRVRFVGHGVVIRGSAISDERNAQFGRDAGAGPIEITVTEFDNRSASETIAEALQLAPGASVQGVVRVLRSLGEPFAHLTSFVPAAIAKVWTSKDLGSKPLHKLLNERGYEIGRVEETVTATLADMSLSEQLQVSAGAPLIKITRSSFSTDGKAIEHMIGLYRPDRYIYRASLSGTALPPKSRLLA